MDDVGAVGRSVWCTGGSPAAGATITGTVVLTRWHDLGCQLAARGLPVRMASRSSEVPFDWNDEHTWPSALVGVDAAYIAYYPDLSAPGAGEQVRRFSQLAVERGVRKLVLLAGRGEPMVAPAEQAVRESGAHFTILEAAFFCQNFSEGALVPAHLVAFEDRADRAGRRPIVLRPVRHQPLPDRYRAPSWKLRTSAPRRSLPNRLSPMKS
jgi:uncharacterized protein YbjT (DUF2867 family)